jgi:hypothetical protein
LSHELDWSNVDQLAATIAAVAPTAILNTASLQSPWSLGTPNAWSRLVRQGGYGVTVALQAALLPALGRALNSARSDAVVVNACYPDVVNAGARRMGVDIRCGVGNIALVAELLRQHLDVSTDCNLRLLAGHWDVGELSLPPEQRSDFPLVWQDGRTIEVSRIRRTPRLSADATVNAFGAGASASLMYALATNLDWRGHVPGPWGELGGYPVRIEAGQLRYDLPRNVTLDEARRWNTARCERDGALVEQGRHLRFSARAEALIRSVAPDLASGFDFKDVESAARAFMELRDVMGKRD